MVNSPTKVFLKMYIFILNITIVFVMDDKAVHWFIIEIC